MASHASIDQVRSDFDEIAALGSGSGSERYDAFIVALVPSSAVDVLDVGCGSGHLSIAITATDRRVLGIDLSPNMISRARASSEGLKGISFVCADFLTHDFGPRLFDCVVSSAMLHHVPEDVTVRRMVSLLRPGGRLLIHDLRADSGLLDRLRSAIAFAHFSLSRLIRTGQVRMRRDLRDAWNRHGSSETYLTLQQTRELANRMLPGARVLNHWLWRSTIVWDKA